MYRYFISFLFVVLVGHGQEQQSKTIDLRPQDSLVFKQKYGLRVGIDLSRPVRGFFQDGYTGLELVGDYRLTNRIFVAAELGNENFTQQMELERETLFDFTTSGSYLKAGIDYNIYKNQRGQNNVISFGGRLAFANFSQTLNEFRFFDSNRFFSPDEFVEGTDVPQEFSGLTATWFEFVVALKVEVLNNLYLGLSVRSGLLITNTESDVFPNLWIPGFNRVNTSSILGVGYNYSISYLIPFYSKKSKAKPELPPN